MLPWFPRCESIGLFLAFVTSEMILALLCPEIHFGPAVSLLYSEIYFALVYSEISFLALRYSEIYLTCLYSEIFLPSGCSEVLLHCYWALRISWYCSVPRRGIGPVVLREGFHPAVVRWDSKVHWVLWFVAEAFIELIFATGLLWVPSSKQYKVTNTTDVIRKITTAKDKSTRPINRSRPSCKRTENDFSIVIKRMHDVPERLRA